MINNNKKMQNKYMKKLGSIFILNSPSLTGDVTCSKLQKDEENCQ